MLQVYCFYQYGDVQEAYRKLNAFLTDLAGLDIDVPLEHIRANTKTYPDYATTTTTIEVAIEMSTLALCEIAGQITELHQRALNSRVEVAAAEPEEKAVASTGDDFDPFLELAPEEIAAGEPFPREVDM